MRNPLDFVNLNGWFDQKYSVDPNIDLGPRNFTMRVALGLFLQRDGGNIVETGTTRVENDWFHNGCSTVIFAETLKEFDAGHLWTVDILPENIEVAKRATVHAADKVTYVVSDSIEFLKNFDREIDLLYLDSFDWSEDEPLRSYCQLHQLNELQLAFNKMKQSSIVLLDDNTFGERGKTKLSKEFLAEQEWTCLLDLQQSLWVFDPFRFVEALII